MELNIIYNENCLETMARMPDGFIDLTVTSPPYDNLRSYNGYEFDFEPIAQELYRVTKKGGVVVWVVGDATVNGSETGTSFRQALYFKEIGFNLETMVWEKMGNGCLGSNYFYGQNFEFMFVLTRGVPITSNLLKDRRNVQRAGTISTTNGGIGLDGKGEYRQIILQEFGIRHNIWKVNPQQLSDHPAPFPESLARDHILSWSNENDLVYDPFMGSGTTAKAAHQLKRRWIGSEISSEYVELANKRLEPYLAQDCLF